MGIKGLEAKGESFYNSRIPFLIEELKEKITEEGSCQLLWIPNEECPLILQKSDGGYTYDSTDLAALKYRIFEEQADQIIYVVDKGQATHFDLLFKTAQIFNSPVNLKHIGFGVIKGENGKRLKSSEGESFKLIDLLNEAIEHCYQTTMQIQEDKIKKNKKIHYFKSEEEMLIMAQKIAISAVKYADLKVAPESDYVFNKKIMLSLSGNTGVYLLYAYARIFNIIRKSQIKENDEKISFSSNPKEQKSGYQLLFHLVQFPDLIEKLSQQMKSNLVTIYLYNLAQKFNIFNLNCQVVNHPNEKSRLQICHLTLKIMKICFNWLGIEPLEMI